MKSKNTAISITGFAHNLGFHIRSLGRVIFEKISFFFAKDNVRAILLILLIAFISFQFSKRIAIGHLRTVIAFSIFFLLAAASVNIRSGIIALVIYLPFMAFIRRYIYVYGRYVSMDPILIIGDIVTILMFSYLVLFRSKDIYEKFKADKAVKFATVLFFIFVLQIFNPRQGNMLVGLGGAKFYIIPFLWFYFGLFLDIKFVKKILMSVAALGVVVSLYGLKQTFFGFTNFEKYWIEWGGYSALHLFQTIRSFSTFASAGEYSHYLAISAVICLAFALKTRQKLINLLALGVILVALFLSAVRSSIFTFVFSSVLLVGFFVRDKRRGIGIILFCLLFLMLFISKFGVVPQVDEYDPLSVTSHHALRGITNPMEESSFKSRVYIWTVDFPRRFIRNPFGYGLGTSTLAAWKFGEALLATENIILDIMLSTGILGAVVFFMFLFQILKRSIVLAKNRKTGYFAILALILPISYLLIGSSSEYTIFPLIWLLWGSIAAIYANEKKKSLSNNRENY